MFVEKGRKEHPTNRGFSVSRVTVIKVTKLPGGYVCRRRKKRGGESPMK